MHQLIRVIVEAQDHDDAQAAVKTMLEGMHGELLEHYDYGTLMHEDGRWSATMPEIVQETGAIRGDREAALELFDEGWQNTVDEFKRNVAIVEAAIDQHDVEELMDDPKIEDVEVEPWNPLGMVDEDADLPTTYSSWFRFSAHEIGRYGGPPIYLYNEWGEGIRTPEKYERERDLLATDSAEEEGAHLFVVPVDVHY